jgi:hypothetical protein
VSPILVRPVREQLEHDRIIRLLHGKFRRRYEAGMNPGAEQNAAVGAGPSALYPDLVLLSQDRGHRLQIVVEIETGESVNHLEALAQWAHYAKTRAPFHLYVPASMVDVARRLCEDNHIHVAEIWSYHVVGDEPRFTLVHRSREAPPVARARPTARPAGTPPKAPVPVRKATHRVAKPPRHVKPRVPKSKTTRPKAAKHTKSAAANKRK